MDFYASKSNSPIPGVPKFDPKRVLDGQRKMTFLKPLPVTSAGRKFEVQTRVVGVYDKGKAGSVVETEQRIVDKENGDVYVKIVGSGFYVGQGNWGGPKGENGSSPQSLGYGILNIIPCLQVLPPSTTLLQREKLPMLHTSTRQLLRRRSFIGRCHRLEFSFREQ